MNILYCGDANIQNGLIISILSLLKNVKEKLNIYVLTMSFKDEIEALSDEQVSVLDNIVKNVNNENFVKKIDISDMFLEEFPKENMKTHFTPCCMLRLYADKIEELPSKILYLDYDVVCRMDCTDFYNQDISSLELVGVLDYYGRWFFRKNLLKSNYINSGVLLLNLDKIRKTGLFQKCRKMCMEKKMFMPDQSAINKVVKFKRIVPRKFNEQKRLHQDTVLQHFTTSFRLFPILHTLTVKPWEIEKMHNVLNIFEYDDILKEYENLCKESVVFEK